MRMNRLRHAIALMRSRMLSGLYRRLANKVTLRDMLPPKFHPHVVSFETSRYRQHYKLLVGGREVGRYDDRSDEWRIRPPFRLLVNESRLPRPEKMEIVRRSVYLGDAVPKGSGTTLEDPGKS